MHARAVQGPYHGDGLLQRLAGRALRRLRQLGLALHSRGVSDRCSMCDQNSTYGLHSLPGGVRLVTCATRTRLMGCTHSRGVSAWLRGTHRLSSVACVLTPNNNVVTSPSPAASWRRCSSFCTNGLYRAQVERCKLTHSKEQTLKPGYHFIGSRVETGWFQAMGQHWIQQLYSPAEAAFMASSLAAATL
jgi:hypothetical protein